MITLSAKPAVHSAVGGWGMLWGGGGFNQGDKNGSAGAVAPTAQHMELVGCARISYAVAISA